MRVCVRAFVAFVLYFIDIKIQIYCFQVSGVIV